MSESEQTFSTAQIAGSLGLTRAMINKYALAIEEFSSKKISQTPKDGRKFSLEDYQLIAKANTLIKEERVTLNTAVKMALGQSALVPTSPNASLVGLDTFQALNTIIGNNRAALEELIAANQANNELLLKEIKRLTDSIQESRVLPTETVDTREDSKESGTGIFSRIGSSMDKLVNRLFGKS